MQAIVGPHSGTHFSEATMLRLPHLVFYLVRRTITRQGMMCT